MINGFEITDVGNGVQKSDCADHTRAVFHT
jgi:hypothetical protein